MVIITPRNWYCKKAQFSNRMTDHYSPESTVNSKRRFKQASKQAYTHVHIAVTLVSGALGVVPTSHHYDDWDAEDGRTSPCMNTIYEYDSRKFPISDWHTLVCCLVY